jgi:hypothetical protein
MSRWEEGRAYDYYGETITCARRWFDGPLEMVELLPPSIDGPCIRTARALAPCVVPQVTETLGGVTRPDACHHDWYGRVLADAGPHAGQLCCEACGTPPLPIAAGDRRSHIAIIYPISVTHIPPICSAVLPLLRGSCVSVHTPMRPLTTTEANAPAFVVRQGAVYLAGVSRRGWAWWTPSRAEAHPYPADEAERLARGIRGESKDKAEPIVEAA